MTRVRLADFVAQWLSEHGITDIFSVSGGGIMFLCDAIGKSQKINYFSTRHEQGSAIAAEAYSRVKGLGACLVTTGPGATNAITGVACAWYDSIPMIVISGQQKRELIADYTKYRNLGPQEANIIPMVTPITKYAKTIMNPESIKRELDKALYLATSGRPGPVWIDIPLDIQDSIIEDEKLDSFRLPKTINKNQDLAKYLTKVIDLLKDAERPVLILGNGVRLSGAEVVLKDLLAILRIPVLLPFGGLDLLPENSPYMAGKFGPGGQRRGNFVLQNSDLVLSIGASLNVASIGFNYASVAPKAKKIMVNIDPNELTKPTLKVDLGIEADAKYFIEQMLRRITKIKFNFDPRWMTIVNKWKKSYPSITDEFYQDKKHVNSYVFYEKLSEYTRSGDIIVTGIGLDACGLYQAYKVKSAQRAFVNKNFGPMGWGLPAAIGAQVAEPTKRIVLVTGDGGLLLNAQELGTIDAYRLPIKIFVFNNNGYESIRSTQKRFFEGRFVGADPSGGVTNPDFKFLAKSYRMMYRTIRNNGELSRIANYLKLKGPVLVEVNIAFAQERVPKASSYKRADGKLESRPLEDMAPFLPEGEIYKIMHTFVVKGTKNL